MSTPQILAELPRLTAEERAQVQAKLDELAGEAWQDRGELSDATNKRSTPRLPTTTSRQTREVRGGSEGPHPSEAAAMTSPTPARVIIRSKPRSTSPTRPSGTRGNEKTSVTSSLSRSMPPSLAPPRIRSASPASAAARRSAAS